MAGRSARIYVAAWEDTRLRRARAPRVRRHSVSPAWELPKEFDVIAAKCVELMRPLSGSFKVFARRSTSIFPHEFHGWPENGGRVLRAQPTI